MRVNGVKTIVRMGVRKGSALLVGVLLASILIFFPASAQASSAGWWPHGWGKGSALPGFWLTGEVTTVEEGSVTLQLPNHHHGRGMMRYVSLQLTLDIDANSVLLNGDLGPLEVATLAEGDTVVVVPRLLWGNLVARLLYAGEPEDLADAGYRGVLVAEEGNTLTLRDRRDDEFTVQVDDATIWYDEGQMARPTTLPDEITLRVLGVAAEDAQGEETVRAVLITPGR